MISIAFSDFFHQKYDDSLYYELYALRDSAQVIYVGISSDIWARWFSIPNSHIGTNFEGRWFANSQVGRCVLENLPASLQWQIELWTLPDCINFCPDYTADKNTERLTIKHMEREMIRRLKPAENILLYGFSRRPAPVYAKIYSEDLQSAHQDIFK